MIDGNAKKRIATTAIALGINIVAIISTVLFNIETTELKIIGSMASVIAVSILVWKFPYGFYCEALIFCFFAATLGSALNLYKTVGFYDRFVHFLSGIVLYHGGKILIEFIFKRRNMKNDFLVENLFALFFSSACAGFWEIYEFVADNLINANMQGSKVNTMGDIISGVLGALVFFVCSAVYNKIKKETANEKI